MAEVLERFLKYVELSEQALKNNVTHELSKLVNGNSVVVGDGYVWYQGTPKGNKVMLLAHLDTRCFEGGRADGKVVIKDGKVLVENGGVLGGDDRAGVAVIMTLVRELGCQVLFLEQEEYGGIGARKFVNQYQGVNLGVDLMIELDRKQREYCFYQEQNQEAIQWVGGILGNDYIHTTAGFTDICVIAPAFNVVAFNMSVGYYNHHTDKEYVVIDELNASVELTKKLVSDFINRNLKFESIRYSRFGFGI